MTISIASRYVSAEEAVRKIKPGMRVRFPLGQTPMVIADHLAARVDELVDVEIVHSAAHAGFPWFLPGFEKSFRVVQEHWAGPANWPMMNRREHDYLPMPFSLRFKADWDGRAAEQRGAEVVCVQTSPPNENGTINLGRQVWDAPEYMRRADTVIAEVVPDMPFIYGDGQLDADLVTYFVEDHSTAITYPVPPDTQPEHQRMAELVAGLIGDGDTLQMGVGATNLMSGPLLELLRQRNDLGWHSESTGLGVPPLIRDGVINSKFVEPHPGVAVSTLWPVTDDNRDILEMNPAVMGREIWKVTNPAVLASISRFKAINSVIMIDLTGQAAAESIGTTMYSGTGGLLEFMIGSLWSPGGRSILVSASRDAPGKRSRIVPILPEGTQVTVPRTLIDTVVTEYGVARLLGKTVRERAQELISVAAPEFRDELTSAARRLFYP